jgi:hypothetical protein
MKRNLLSHLVTLLLILICNTTFSQGGTSDKPKDPNPNAFKVEKVEIIDVGKIVTDFFTIVSGDLPDYINKQSSVDKNVVMTYAVPKTWEGKMKEVKDKAHWPTIQQYNAWRIAASPTYDVLQIKASENTSMPDGFKPTRDFYIVIHPSGVRKVTEQTGAKNLVPACGLVNAMYAASDNNFTNIKGKPIASPGVSSLYEAKVNKGDADKIYLKELLGMKELIAEYGTYTSLSKASEQFYKLLQNFKSCNNLEAKKIDGKADSYNIVPNRGFVIPQVAFKIEKENEEYKIMLSIFRY